MAASTKINKNWRTDKIHGESKNVTGRTRWQVSVIYRKSFSNGPSLLPRVSQSCMATVTRRSDTRSMMHTHTRRDVFDGDQCTLINSSCWDWRARKGTREQGNGVNSLVTDGWWTEWKWQRARMRWCTCDKFVWFAVDQGFFLQDIADGENHKSSWLTFV